MYQLQILRQALEDMQSSVSWYNEQQAGLGERFLAEVVKTLRLTEANPLHYEQKFSKKFRFAGIHGFPFVVVFKVKSKLVIINSVFHTSRNPKNLFNSPAYGAAPGASRKFKLGLFAKKPGA